MYYKCMYRLLLFTVYLKEAIAHYWIRSLIPNAMGVLQVNEKSPLILLLEHPPSLVFEIVGNL